MDKAQKLVLAVGVSIAIAFTFSCSSDDGNDDKGGSGEKYITITGLEEYNGYYAAATLSKGATVGVSDDGCVGAEKSDKAIADGKIKLLVAENGSTKENMKPCPNGEYSMMLMLSEDPEDTQAGMNNINLIYTNGNDECVSITEFYSGEVPKLKLSKNDITLNLSKFNEAEYICLGFDFPFPF